MYRVRGFRPRLGYRRGPRPMNFDDPKPAPDTRKLQQITLRPSLREEIERRRGKITRSEWIERAIREKIAREDKTNAPENDRS